jgi:hypothetical protein
MSASRRKVCERSSRIGSTRGSAGWLARDDCGKSDQLGFDWTEMIANNEKKSPPSDDYRRCWTTEEEFVVDVRIESSLGGASEKLAGAGSQFDHSRTDDRAQL